MTTSSLAAVGVSSMILNGPCHFGFRSSWGLSDRPTMFPVRPCPQFVKGARGLGGRGRQVVVDEFPEGIAEFCQQRGV